jgi:hypothetical protein
LLSKSGKRKSKGRKKKKEVKLATTELLRGAETEKLLKFNHDRGIINFREAFDY